APENLAAIWQQIFSIAGFALASDLRKIHSIAISGPNSLVLRISERYNTPGSPLLDPARLARVEALVSQVVGQACTARVQTTTDEGARPPSEVAGGVRQVRERVKQLPLVQKARDLLGAEILFVDPAFGEVAVPANLPEADPNEEPAEEE